MMKFKKKCLAVFGFVFIVNFLMLADNFKTWAMESESCDSGLNNSLNNSLNSSSLNYDAGSELDSDEIFVNPFEEYFVNGPCGGIHNHKIKKMENMKIYDEDKNFYENVDINRNYAKIAENSKLKLDNRTNDFKIVNKSSVNEDSIKSKEINPKKVSYKVSHNDETTANNFIDNTIINENGTKSKALQKTKLALDDKIDVFRIINKKTSNNDIYSNTDSDLSDVSGEKERISCCDLLLGDTLLREWDKYEEEKLEGDEKKADRIEKHRYSENNMFDGKNSTYVTNDLKIYSDGTFDLNFDFYFGYKFQKYKIDLDILTNQKDIEISFFKNKLDYDLNRVALTKKIVPLRKSVNGGAKSNVLVYRFCLKFDEIKNFLNEGKIYFKMPIMLDLKEGSNKGGFIELNLNGLKTAALNGLSVFYEKFYESDEAKKLIRIDKNESFKNKNIVQKQTHLDEAKKLIRIDKNESLKNKNIVQKQTHLEKLEDYLQKLGFSESEVLKFSKEFEGSALKNKKDLFCGWLSFLNNLKDDDLEKSEYIEDRVKLVPKVLCVEKNKKLLAVVDSISKFKISLASGVDSEKLKQE